MNSEDKKDKKIKIISTGIITIFAVFLIAYFFFKTSILNSAIIAIVIGLIEGIYHYFKN